MVYIGNYIHALCIAIGQGDLPVAINTPPPKQFKMDKIKFLRSEPPEFFRRDTRRAQNGSRTVIMVTKAITIRRMNFIRVTDAILIDARIDR